MSLVDRLTRTLAERLPAMENLTASDSWIAYFGAAHLAVFYLAGRYYSLAQRLADVRYISTVARRPGQRPPSYEVLGVLLVIQIAVKALLRLHRYRRAQSAKVDSATEPEEKEEEKQPNDGDGLDVIRLDGVRWSHKSAPAALLDDEAFLKHADGKPERPIAPLAYPDPTNATALSAQDLGLPLGAAQADLDTARAAAKGRATQLESIAQSVLRCTLCMEQRAPQKGGSAVTECGHVFCWDCITAWAREKPECPLCRQAIAANRLLPVYNF